MVPGSAAEDLPAFGVAAHRHPARYVPRSGHHPSEIPGQVRFLAALYLLLGFPELPVYRDEENDRQQEGEEEVCEDPPTAAAVSPAVSENLRRAIATIRRMKTPAQRERCLESLGSVIGEAGAAGLADELLSGCANEQERALINIGLASGMS